MSFSPSEYWNNRLKDNFNLVGVGDISMGMAYNKYSYHITFKGLQRLYNKYCTNKAGKILDIGSGIGFIVGTWEKSGYININGSDISSFAVQELKKNYEKYSFYELDISADMSALNGQKFDYITCASVLYHIVDNTNWQNALKNIRSVMNIDGVFIFSEGFPVSDYGITHQVSRSREMYKKTLADAGFEVIKSMPNYVLMSDPAGTRNKLYKYWWGISSRISRKYPKLAYMWWSLVYPFELILTQTMKQTPGQEFWVCKAV